MKNPIRLLTAIFENKAVQFGFGEGLTIPFLTGCCTDDELDAEPRIRRLIDVIVGEDLGQGFELRLQSCPDVGEILALKRAREAKPEPMLQVAGTSIYCRGKNFPNADSRIRCSELAEYLLKTYTALVERRTFSFDKSKREWTDYSASDIKFIAMHG